MSPRLRKLLFWSSGIAIGLVVLLTATILIAERYIDTPKVRMQLGAKLSELLNGQVTWQQLEIRLLPLPHGVVRDAHISIPNVVNVDVATVDITVGLWPLFHGNAEVQAISLERPSVDIWISATDEAKSKESPNTNPLALYRSAMRPVVDALSRFAPDTTVAIEDGRVALHLPDLSPLEANNMDLRIVTDKRGVAIDLSAIGTYWDHVTIDGRVEYDDLRASAKVRVAGLKPQSVLEEVLTDIRESLVLSDVGAELEAHSDGKTDINIKLGLELPRAEMKRRGRQVDIVEVRLAGTIKFVEDDIAIALDDIHLGELAPTAKASLTLTGSPRAPKLDIAVDELDLARLRDAAITLAGEQPVIKEYIARIHGGRLNDLRFSTQADRFADLFALSRLHGSVRLTDGSMLVPTLEREATRIAAQAELINGAIKVSEVSVQLGASRIRQAGIDIILLAPMRMEKTHGQATIALHDLLPGLRTREPFIGILQSVPALTGTAEATVRNVALRFDTPTKVTYDLTVKPQRVRVQADALPGPLAVHGGNVRITPRAINAERIGIEMLASKATVSGELTHFQAGKPRIAARVADGVIEQQLIDWIWQRFTLDADLKPTTPLRVAAQRLQWSDAGLDVIADATFKAGPTLNVEISTSGATIALRRATIKDRDSNATFSFSSRDSLIQMGFDGVLAGETLMRIFDRPGDIYAGNVKGNIEATLDLKRQGRNAASGKLAGEHIDLSNLIDLPLKLDRFDLQGDGSALQIRELAVDWAEQKATIRGAITRSAKELDMALEVDSPGIVIDALRTAPSDTAPRAAVNKSEPDKPFDLWSLPLKGTVALRTDHLTYRNYRIEEIQAVATLQQNAATLALNNASLCGIYFPLSLHVTPQQFDANVNLVAKDQSLGGVAECFGNAHLIISGQFNLTSALSVKGPTDKVVDSFTKHLSGSVEFAARDGDIRKMALLGNILSLKSVSELAKGEIKLGDKGFTYRSITAGATIADGKMTFEQAALDSSALGLAANGTLDLENYDSRLTVLVAPFGTLDRIVRNTPVLGYIIGGAFTSIPVSVVGDIRNPTVVPLGPRAVGSEVMGIFERTFKLPGKMVEPLSKSPSK